MIHLTNPWIFLLFPLPFIVHYFFPQATLIRNNALKVPFFTTLQQLNQNTKKRTTRSTVFKFSLWSGLWLLLLIAASQPEWLSRPLPIVTKSPAIMLAVDISGSMNASKNETSSPKSVDNQLDLVKKEAIKLLNARPYDRFGLVLFGSHAFLQVPLTLDHHTVQTQLLDATPGLAGPRTAIGDALGLAIKSLLSVAKSSRSIILLTDGGNNSGSLPPFEAAQIAAELGIKINVISLPTLTNIADTTADTTHLAQLATLTHGAYFAASSAGSLDRILAQLMTLEPAGEAPKPIRTETPLSPWLLGIAVLLSVVLI